MTITPEIQADAVRLLEGALAAVDTFADRRRLILGVGDRCTLAASVVIALSQRSNAAPSESPVDRGPSANQAVMRDELRIALQSIPTAEEVSQHVDRLTNALRQVVERRRAASGSLDHQQTLEAAAEEDRIGALSRELLQSFSGMTAALRTVAAALGLEIVTA